MLKINTFEDLTKRLILEDLVYKGTQEDLQSIKPGTKAAKTELKRASRVAKRLADKIDVPIPQKLRQSRGSFVRASDGIFKAPGEKTIMELAKKLTNGGDIRAKIEKWEQFIDSDIEIIKDDIDKIESGKTEITFWQDDETENEPPYQLTASDVINDVEALIDYIKKLVGSYTVAPEHARSFFDFIDRLKNKLVDLKNKLDNFKNLKTLNTKEKAEIGKSADLVDFWSEEVVDIAVAGTDKTLTLADNIIGLFPDIQNLKNFMMMRVLTNFGLVKGPFRSLSQVDRLQVSTSRANKKAKQIEKFFTRFNQFKNAIAYIDNSDDIVNIMDTLFKNSAHNIMEKTGIDLKDLLVKIIGENKIAADDWSFFFDIPENLDNELIAFLTFGYNHKLKRANQLYDKNFMKQAISNINDKTIEDVKDTQRYMHAYAKTLGGSENFTESFFVNKKEFSLLAEETDDDSNEFDDFDNFDDFEDIGSEDISGAEVQQSLQASKDDITNKIVGDVIAKSDKIIAKQAEDPDADLLQAAEKFKLSDEIIEDIREEFPGIKKAIIEVLRFFKSINLTPKETLRLLNFLQLGTEVYFDENLHPNFVRNIEDDADDAMIDGLPYGVKEYEKSMLRTVMQFYKTSNRQYVIDMLEKAINNIENCTTEDLVNYIKNDPTAERIREILPTIASFDAETLNAKNFPRPQTLIDSLKKDQFTTVLAEDLQVSLIWLLRRIIAMNAAGPHKGELPGGFTVQNVLKYLKFSTDVTALRARRNLKEIYDLDINALETDEKGDFKMFKTFEDLSEFLYLNDNNLLDAAKTFKRRYMTKKRDESGISTANIDNIVSVIKKALNDVKKYDVKAADEEITRYIADCLANVIAFQAEIMLSTSTKPKEFQSRIMWGAFINQAIKEFQKKYGIDYDKYSSGAKEAADYLNKAKSAIANKTSVPVINFTGSKIKHITKAFYTPESVTGAYAAMGSIITADGRTIKKGEQGEPFRGPEGETYETITRSSLKRYNTHEEYVDVLASLPEEEPDVTEEIRHVPDYWIPTSQREDYDMYILAPAVKNEVFAFSIYQAICWFLTNKIFYGAKGGQAQKRVRAKGQDEEVELEKAINELKKAVESVRKTLPHSVDIKRALEKRYGRWVTADISKYIGDEVFDITGPFNVVAKPADQSTAEISLIFTDKIIGVLRNMDYASTRRKNTLPNAWERVREHEFAKIAKKPSDFFAKGKYNKLVFSFHNTPNISENITDEYGWDVNGLEIKVKTIDDSDLNSILDSEEAIIKFIRFISDKIKEVLDAAGSIYVKTPFIKASRKVKNPLGISLDFIKIGDKLIERLIGVNDEDQDDTEDQDNDDDEKFSSYNDSQDRGGSRRRSNYDDHEDSFGYDGGYQDDRGYDDWGGSRRRSSYDDYEGRFGYDSGYQDDHGYDDGYSILGGDEEEEEEVLMAVTEMEPEITLAKPHHKKEKCKCKKMLPNKDRFKRGYERMNRQYEDFFRRH